MLPPEPDPSTQSRAGLDGGDLRVEMTLTVGADSGDPVCKAGLSNRLRGQVGLAGGVSFGMASQRSDVITVSVIVI